MGERRVYGYRKSGAFRWMAAFLILGSGMPFFIEAQGGQLNLPKAVVSGMVVAILVPLLIKHWNNAVVLDQDTLAYRGWLGKITTRIAWSQVARLSVRRNLDPEGNPGAVFAEAHGTDGAKITFVETIEDFEGLLSEIANRSGLNWE